MAFFLKFQKVIGILSEIILRIWIHHNTLSKNSARQRKLFDILSGLFGRHFAGFQWQLSPNVS